MNLSKTVESLEKKGYQVSVFANAKEASRYLNEEIDKTSVAFGGSKTIESMGLFESLSEHNEVLWHWYPKEGMTPAETLKTAADTDVYLTSANGISEDGEIVNIDGTGNRLASTLYGHRKVYFIVGSNKLAPNLHEAIYRARNVASPLNAKRLNRGTPCGAGDKCYDCSSPERICSAMVVHFQKMGSCEMEVVLIEESLGF